MSITITSRIPANQINAFDTILKENRGYYKCKAGSSCSPDKIYVVYGFFNGEDYTAFLTEWNRYKKPIKETVRNYPWYVKLWRNLKSYLKDINT